MIDIYKLKSTFFSEYNYNQIQREKDCLYYAKIVHVPTQTQAEKTRKLRDIKIDESLGNISMEEYNIQAKEINDMSVEDNDSMPMLVNHVYNKTVEKRMINMTISDEIAHLSDTNDFINKDLYRIIYHEFQKILSEIETKDIESMTDYNREIYDLRINHHDGLYEYSARENIDGKVFTESPLLRPDQVLISPMGIYFDIEDSYLGYKGNSFNPELRMDYYLDIIDKEDTILFNLKF